MALKENLPPDYKPCSWCKEWRRVTKGDAMTARLHYKYRVLIRRYIYVDDEVKPRLTVNLAERELRYCPECGQQLSFKKGPKRDRL